MVISFISQRLYNHMRLNNFILFWKSYLTHACETNYSHKQLFTLDYLYSFYMMKCKVQYLLWIIRFLLIDVTYMLVISEWTSK